jgi:hypothetical protein
LCCQKAICLANHYVIGSATENNLIAHFFPFPGFPL